MPSPGRQSHNHRRAKKLRWLAIPAVAMLVMPPIAAGHTSTWIACRTPDTVGMIYRQHPRSCTLSNDKRTVYARQLHWHRWGAARTKAHGRGLHAVASRKRRDPYCSKDHSRFYTRVTVHKDGQTYRFNTTPEWAVC